MKHIIRETLIKFKKTKIILADADAEMVFKYISTGKAFYDDETENASAIKIADIDENGIVDMPDVIMIPEMALAVDGKARS